MNKTKKDPKRHAVRLKHQIMVQIESLFLLLPRGRCRGSGRENTSTGRECPSLGNRDSVSERWVLVGGGGSRGWVRVALAKSAGGTPESDDVSDGDGDGLLVDLGAWCANQPCTGSTIDERRSDAMRGSESKLCREVPATG